jgi:hypothetical protein
MLKLKKKDIEKKWHFHRLIYFLCQKKEHGYQSRIIPKDKSYFFQLRFLESKVFYVL